MSLRAHLLAFVIKRQVKSKAGLSNDVHQARAMMDKATLPSPRGVRFEAGTCGGIAGEWAKARKPAGPVRHLLYIHGGGFIACSARTHRPITGAFAARGFTVFAPNYRLAPEDPFPAGLDDVFAAWCGLAADGPAAVAGDSAGGTLALALLLRAKAEGCAMPGAAAAFSPATDLLGTGESHASNARRDAMLDPDRLGDLVPAYMGAGDPRQPLASPLYGDLAGLPPVLLHVGEREILRDDSVRFAAKARAAGVTVALAVVPVVPHTWQLFGFLPEARVSLDAAAAFLRAHTPVDSPSVAGPGVGEAA